MSKLSNFGGTAFANPSIIQILRVWFGIVPMSNINDRHEISLENES